MSDLLLKIFFISLLLIQLPPIYFLFPLFNLHSISKILIFILFISVVLFKYRSLSKLINQHKIFFNIFLFFFTSQSFSIINAVNLFDFFKKYENFLFASFLVFLIFLFLEKKRDIKIIIYILFFGFLINSLFQFIIFFSHNFFIYFGKFFINPSYVDLIEFNFKRARVYFESFDEFLLPFLFYFLVFKKEKKLSLMTIFSIIFLSLISNFRTKIIMLFFGLFSSLFLYFKNIKPNVSTSYTSLIFFCFLIIFYLTTKYQSTHFGINIIERVVITDFKSFDFQTVISRFEKWKTAIDIGMAFSIGGIGLGNYFNYLSSSSKNHFSLTNLKKWNLNCQ